MIQSNLFPALVCEFPSTRYQGSKSKLVDWIWNSIKHLDFTTCLDAFGGTGAVSYMLKQKGKEVTYNDILRFNYLFGIALIENDSFLLSDNKVDWNGHSIFISEQSIPDGCVPFEQLNGLWRFDTIDGQVTMLIPRSTALAISPDETQVAYIGGQGFATNELVVQVQKKLQRVLQQTLHGVLFPANFALA